MTTVDLGVWGRAPCEDGAFDGVENRVEVAKRIAQAKWVNGEEALITRADVEGALDK